MPRDFPLSLFGSKTCKSYTESQCVTTSQHTSDGSNDVGRARRYYAKYNSVQLENHEGICVILKSYKVPL